MSGRFRRPTGPAVPLWASTAATAGWVFLWAGVAWGGWHNGAADSDLLAHGRAATGVVVAAVQRAQIKLGYCEQLLKVPSRTGGSLTVPATRPCADPWTVGEIVHVIVDDGPPARAVVAEEAQTPLSTKGLQILVVTFAAVIAGYPVGRLMIAYGRHRARGIGRPEAPAD